MLESEIQQDRSMSLLLTEEAKTDRLERIIGNLMAELGLDLPDQHFAGTPARVARLYRELTRGSRVDSSKILKTFDSKHSELIVVSEINVYSLCPHHLLIYSGKMHHGYVPDGRIVGLSKIPRLIQASADSHWRLPFEELKASLTECHGADSVRLAYTEFLHPTLADLVREAARHGKAHLRVLPLFLAAGVHGGEDIPRQIAACQESFPQVKIELLPPIGEHSCIKELFREIASDYARD